MILALAAAVAVAFAGCGGGDDSDSRTTGTETAGAERAATNTRTSSQGEPAAGKGPGKAPATPGQGAAAQGPGGGEGKQGPAISPPKGRQEVGITAEQRETAKVASIALMSPAVLPVANAPSELPAPYTCDGRDTWPALRWSGAPAGTEELVLFLMGLRPADGKIAFAFAAAGIDPELTEIETGKLPKGAVMGEGGYSLCPPAGQSETYFFALYALPERLSAKRGFDPVALRKEVQELSRDVGLLAVSYAR